MNLKTGPLEIEGRCPACSCVPPGGEKHARPTTRLSLCNAASVARAKCSINWWRHRLRLRLVSESEVEWRSVVASSGPLLFGELSSHRFLEFSN